MDRVNTVDMQGGKIKMLQDYVQKLQGGERDYTTYDKFKQPYQDRDWETRSISVI